MPNLGQAFCETLNSPGQQMSSDCFFLFDPISFGSVPASLSSPITRQLKGSLCGSSGLKVVKSSKFDQQLLVIELKLYWIFKDKCNLWFGVLGSKVNCSTIHDLRQNRRYLSLWELRVLQ